MIFEKNQFALIKRNNRRCRRLCRPWQTPPLRLRVSPAVRHEAARDEYPTGRDDVARARGDPRPGVRDNDFSLYGRAVPHAHVRKYHLRQRVEHSVYVAKTTWTWIHTITDRH